MSILSSLLGKKQALLDQDEAVRLFKAHPEAYFTYRGEPSKWPVGGAADKTASRPIFPDDVRVLVHGQTLGFVESVEIKCKTATIRHIAVAKELTGVNGKKYGLGAILARSYAAQVHARYGVDQIVFAENHNDYNNAGYAKFFLAIGATPLPIDLRTTLPGRPDFLWPKSAW